MRGKPPDHGERVKAGMQRARASGRKPGIGQNAPDEMIKAHLQQGWSAIRVQRELCVGYRVIKRVRDAMERGEPISTAPVIREASDDEIRARLAEGWSMARISREMNATRHAIKCVRDEMKRNG